MDTKNEVSPEEQKAEQEALAEAKEEEIRSNIIIDLGFDEVADAERIDKLVAKEMANRKALSQAIGQKIKHRTEAQDLRTKVVVPPAKIAPAPEEVEKLVGKTVNETLERRDLESLDYPDELKATIRKVASTNGISIKAALADSYVKFQIEAYEKAKDTDEASVSRKHNAGGKKTYSLDNPPDVNMNTKEGREEWDRYTEGLKKQGY